MSTHFLRGALAAVLAAAPALPAAAQTPAVPFTVSVREITPPPGTPALQSFAMGRLGSDWVLVGGRRNGFHRTSTRESTFPTATANDSIYVLDMAANRTYSAPLPPQFRSILRVSNTNYVQSDGYLYIVGGYGSTCDNDDPSCYQTYPNLTLILLSLLVDYVKKGEFDRVASTMVTTVDERMRVTGGALEKIGDTFYLVMGHDYHSIYKGAVNGIYSDQVRAFRLPRPQTPVIQDYVAYGDPAGGGPASQWHRRDLNVVPTVQPDGAHGLAIYGGVFTPTSGAWVNPIYMTLPADGGTPVFTVDAAFSMKTSQYECAHVTMYDPGSGTMYTTLLGGISGWRYDANGNLVPSNSLPWTGTITTLARAANGPTSEVVQPASQGLPGRRGANAVFVPDEDRAMVAGTHEVIDYSRLPAGDSVRVGWMYGGIFATADQSSEFDPTFASNKIYEVWLHRPTAVAHRE